jgi:tetratricopeptide (TPR) repeat protein
VDWNTTVRKLERALARNPRSRLFLPLAEAHRELGHYNRATELFQAGISHHPGYIRARIGLARTYILMGRLEEARQELHQAISLAPDNALARRLLAELHLKEGQSEQAATELRALLRRQPDAAGQTHELERLIVKASAGAAGSHARTEARRVKSPANAAAPEPVAQDPAVGALPEVSVPSTEEWSVNESGSRPIFRPGVGIAAARQAQLAAGQSAEDGRSSAAGDEQFEAVFGLPSLHPASEPLRVEQWLEEFFPGAFPLPQPPEPAQIEELAPLAWSPSVETPQAEACVGRVEPAAEGLELLPVFAEEAFVGAEAAQVAEREPVEAEPAAALPGLSTEAPPLEIELPPRIGLPRQEPLLEVELAPVAGPPAEEPTMLEAFAPTAPTEDSGARAKVSLGAPGEDAAEAPPIQTLSLVELYIEQGFVSEAREILEQMARANPRNRQVRERLDSLRAAAPEVESAGDVLKRWLDAVQTVKRERRLVPLA